MTTDENQIVAVFSPIRDVFSPFESNIYRLLAIIVKNPFIKNMQKIINTNMTSNETQMIGLFLLIITLFFYSYFMHRKEKKSIEIEQKRQSLKKLVPDEEDEFEADYQDDSANENDRDNKDENEEDELEGDSQKEDESKNQNANEKEGENKDERENKDGSANENEGENKDERENKDGNANEKEGENKDERENKDGNANENEGNKKPAPPHEKKNPFERAPEIANQRWSKFEKYNHPLLPIYSWIVEFHRDWFEEIYHKY